MSKVSVAARLLRLATGLLAGTLLLALPTPVHAGHYWSDEAVSDALTQASHKYGVSRSFLRCIAGYETGWTFDPSLTGDDGESWGLFMLHRRGLRPDFYTLGYSDPFNPYEASDFAAYYIAHYGWKGARNWAPVLLGLC